MSKFFPFISRCSHQEIRAADRELIVTLRKQIDDQDTRFAAERLTLQSLAENAIAAMKPPVEAPRRRRELEAAPSPTPDTLDLSQIDPADNEALLLIAQREVPQGAKVSASAMMRSVERLREQVIEAHISRSQTASTPAYVPATIAGKIAAAEEAGRNAAKQQIEVGV